MCKARGSSVSQHHSCKNAETTRNDRPTKQTMTEDYRPGLLSSLLLGGGGEDAAAASATRAAPTKNAAAAAPTAVSVGGSPADLARHEDSLTPSETSASFLEQPKGVKKAKKKKKKKRKDDDKKGQENSAAGDDGDGAFGEEGPPVGQQQGLASLFSASNLKKFSRRERADKAEDAAEVGGWLDAWVPCVSCSCDYDRLYMFLFVVIVVVFERIFLSNPQGWPRRDDASTSTDYQ